MGLELGLAPLWLVLLCSFRVLPVLVLTPLLGSFPIPALIKTMIVLVVSIAMTGFTGSTHVPLPADVLGLGAAALSEFTLGGLLSIGIHAVFGAVSIAGKLIDLQAGFGLGAIFDPISRRSATVMQSALGMLCVVVFFSMDMHLVLLRMLAESLHTVPLGSGPFDVDVGELIRRSSTLFALGLAFAGPLVMLLFLFDLGLAVMSRSVPQLNVTFLGIGIKIAVAIVFIATLASTWGDAFRRLLSMMAG
ncbi:flagellar biosynthetic protein FliR [Aquabacterium humicola]|uniref:flagellar biosynthetic protein FliR n=1 Tax=Aquabacterium humicola TaxID=3237377 RepID=UPI002542FA1F|nr:flagellar biosynthetic protein FliR [Rubrivivax pictus]